jgi:hypothetical protein
MPVSNIRPKAKEVLLIVPLWAKSIRGNIVINDLPVSITLTSVPDILTRYNSMAVLKKSRQLQAALKMGSIVAARPIVETEAL